jgi:hypothetical protein
MIMRLNAGKSFSAKQKLLISQENIWWSHVVKTMAAIENR